MLNQLENKKFRKAVIALAAFAYSLFSLQVVQADDIDIYLESTDTGKGGAPVINFVIDTSGSMGWRITGGGTPSNIFDERMMPLLYSLYDQFSSMKGTFKVGLFSYDAGGRSGNKEKDALPLESYVTEQYQSFAIGPYNQASSTAAQWLNGGDLEPDQDFSLTFPYISNVIPSPEINLGTRIFGQWTNSAGLNNDLSLADSDYNGVGLGNKSVKFRVTGTRAAGNWQQYRFRRSANHRIDAYLNGVYYNAQYRGNWYMWVYARPGDEIDFVMGTTTNNHVGNFEVYRSSRYSGVDGYFYVPAQPPLADQPQSTALQFDAFHLPPGATIISANLRFVANGNSDAQTIQVRLDESLNPAPLSGSGADIEARQWLNQAVKLIPSQNSNDAFSIDVKSLIELKVAQADYCIGRDLVFTIPGSAPTALMPISAQGSVVLDVIWSGGTPCYVKDVEIKSNGIGDDVYLANDNSLVRDSETIELGNSQAAGLRFTVVNLAKYDIDPLGNKLNNDLSVDNASLSLVASSNGSAGTIMIQAVEQGIGQINGTDDPDLLGRPLGNAITWNVPSWNQGTTYTSPDLSAIINPLLSRTDWEYGGTIGLVLTTPTIAPMQFYAWEADDDSFLTQVKRTYPMDWGRFGTLAPKLTISASATNPINMSTTAREDIINHLFSNAMRPTGGTPIAGSYAEASAYMLGATTSKGNYDSPLDVVGACQSNTMVLLTDGEESYTTSTGSSKFTDLVGGSCNYSNSWDCNNHLAEKLAEGVDWFDGVTVDAPDPKRRVKTYTIGYGPYASSGTIRDRLNAVAIKGDGAYYSAAQVEQLSSAFKEIVASSDDSGVNVSAAGVAVSAFNRISLLDEVYYGLFKPVSRRNWGGNTKRYRLANSSIVDVNAADVVDATTDSFNDEAQSWWSLLADGPVVEFGGAAAKITPVNRKLYTYMGEAGSSLGIASGSLSNRGLDLSSNGTDLMAISSSDLSDADLGLPATIGYSGSSAAERTSRKASVLKWVQGGTAAEPRTVMGSPIHSSPVMIGYNETAGDLVSTLFVSTTEGYLHAIDTGEPSKDNPAQDRNNRGGKELFGFMPKETLRNAALLEENASKAENEQHIYGLDSNWTFWRNSGDDPTIGTGDHVYLYGGMRRGGRMIYGLNVSNVYEGGAITPKLLFAIGNPNGMETELAYNGPYDSDGTTPITGSVAGSAANKDFSRIGQTWSQPRFGKILWDGQTEARPVLFFGGGYDPKHDDPSYSDLSDNDKIGNQVYMVDAINGKLIWMAETDSAIAARLVTVDKDGDSYIDGFYAVDLSGRVLRYDFNGQTDFTDHVIARLGVDGGGDGSSSTGKRKFDTQPSIALVRNQITQEIDVMIAVGSGYRAHLDDTDIQERFYLLFDRGAYSDSVTAPAYVIDSSDTAKLLPLDVLNSVSKDPRDTVNLWNIHGWFYDFDRSRGEKAIGRPLIFNNILLFTSYINDTLGAGDICEPRLGSSRLYVLDINGGNRTDIFGITNSTGYIENVSEGFVDGPQVVEDNEGLRVLVGGPDAPGAGTLESCTLENCNLRPIERTSWTTTTTPANGVTPTP